MNVLYSKVLNLLRVLAVCFILPAIAVLAVYLLKARQTQTPIQPLRCLWLSIPLVIGIVILIKSQAWARRLTQDFDE